MFQIHNAKTGGGVYWTLQDQGNNETLCTSEIYESVANARIGIAAAISAAALGNIDDLTN
ncbi:MAG TPA: DUF1508 domain-containing protein [Allosphingosinicella sp.]|jgi:uncharacterized protein YegP (UPF0339 family)